MCHTSLKRAGKRRMCLLALTAGAGELTSDLCEVFGLAEILISGTFIV